MSKKIIHKANTRGHANHGWLDSHHTFSFARYHNPERMNFGLLRVLNDDVVAPGMGFGAHPHDNMEIISIPLAGELAHQDSTGNKKVIKTNDVQIMSAGSGLTPRRSVGVERAQGPSVGSGVGRLLEGGSRDQSVVVPLCVKTQLRGPA